MRPSKQGEQCDDGELRGEGFGRRHADLRPGVHIDASVAFASDRAGNVVADPERPMPLALALAQGRQRVGRLPALADHKDEGVACHRQVAVTQFACKFAFHREVG